MTTESQQIVQLLEEAERLLTSEPETSYFLIERAHPSVRSHPIARLLQAFALYHTGSFRAARRMAQALLTDERFTFYCERHESFKENCEQVLELSTRVLATKIPRGREFFLEREGILTLDELLVTDPPVASLVHESDDSSSIRIASVRKVRWYPRSGILQFEDGRVLKESVIGLSLAEITGSIFNFNTRENGLACFDESAFPADNGTATFDSLNWVLTWLVPIKVLESSGFRGKYILWDPHPIVMSFLRRAGVSSDQVVSLSRDDGAELSNALVFIGWSESALSTQIQVLRNLLVPPTSSSTGQARSLAIIDERVAALEEKLGFLKEYEVVRWPSEKKEIDNLLSLVQGAQRLIVPQGALSALTLLAPPGAEVHTLGFADHVGDYDERAFDNLDRICNALGQAHSGVRIRV